IFGESGRGQTLRAAGQQRQERAARRVRAASAAVEPRRHIGAAKRVFEKAKVAAWRTDENGHLVEAHATACLLQDTARDFHALAPFARRGEQLKGTIGLA